MIKGFANLDSTAYQAFTDQLLASVTRDSRVLGVVALGSMAAPHRRDRWSDHDFFLIVTAGNQEHFRQHLDWLPKSDEIVLQLRETAHGLKVMYRDGHLIEFAVFDTEELFLARVNDYAVLFDRANIAELMTQVHSKSVSLIVDPHKELLHVLGLLQVGAGRYARGEKLSAHVFIKIYALGHLLPVLVHYLDSPDKSRLDNLDVYRRFEFAYPEIGRELNAILLQDSLTSARLMLTFIEQHLKAKMTDFPQAAIDTLHVYLQIIDAQ